MHTAQPGTSVCVCWSGRRCACENRVREKVLPNKSGKKNSNGIAKHRGRRHRRQAVRYTHLCGSFLLFWRLKQADIRRQQPGQHFNLVSSSMGTQHTQTRPHPSTQTHWGFIQSTLRLLFENWISDFLFSSSVKTCIWDVLPCVCVPIHAVLCRVYMACTMVLVVLVMLVYHITPTILSNIAVKIVHSPSHEIRLFEPNRSTTHSLYSTDMCNILCHCYCCCKVCRPAHSVYLPSHRRAVCSWYITCPAVTEKI